MIRKIEFCSIYSNLKTSFHFIKIDFPHFYLLHHVLRNYHVRSPDQLGKNAAINASFRVMTSWGDVTLTCTEDEMGVLWRSNRRTCISSVSSVQCSTYYLLEYVRVYELQQYFRVCRPIPMPSGHNLQCTSEPYY